MQALRTEAGSAYIQREVGAVEGITRAMQAAMAPTDTQRVMQNGYQGIIVGGENREQISTTIGADGMPAYERLVERSVVFPDGNVNVQQVTVTGAGDVTYVLARLQELETVNAALHTRLVALETNHAPVKRIKHAFKKQYARTRKSHPTMDWKPYLTHRNGRWGYKRVLGRTSKYIEKQGFETSDIAHTAMQRSYAAYETSLVVHAEPTPSGSRENAV